MNKVTLVGNVVNDLELKDYKKDEKEGKYVRFTLAVNEYNVKKEEYENINKTLKEESNNLKLKYAQLETKINSDENTIKELLEDKKKEEEKKTPACACSCGCAASEAESITNDCCPDLKEGEICCIKVLGAGCKSCHEQFEYTKQAVKDMGLSVEVEYITDMQKVMEYGVMSMPALVVNEKVVAMGKVLKAADVVALLHKLGF